MDDNMNYNQIDDYKTSGESQPIYQEQPYQVQSQEASSDLAESSVNGYVYSKPVEPIPQGMGTPPVQMEQPTSNGLAIAGMVCGIVSLVVVCCFAPISIVCGITGIILSIIALNKKQSKGMSIAGIITSGVAILLAVLIIIISVVSVLTFEEQIGNGDIEKYYYNELYDELYDELDAQYF